MKRLILILALIALVVLPIPVTAQTQPCNKSVNVNAASGVSSLVAAVAGSTIRVCGFVLSSLAANSGQLLSGTNPITGVLFIAANDNVAFGNGDSIAIIAATGAALQISVGATTVTGVVLYQQD